MAANLEHLNALDLQQQGAALRALGRSLLAGAGDDLAQDGWLAAMRARAPRHLGGWLVGTVRRLAASQRRRDARRQRRELEAARPEALPSSVDTVAAAEVARRITAAVAGLHEPYRTAVVLRFWHGLEPQQLGARLGVTANTARSRVQRGVELLRARLSHECGGRTAWAAPLVAMLEHEVSTVLASSTASLLPVLAAMKTKMLLAFAVIALVVGGLPWFDAPPQQVNPGACADSAVMTSSAPVGASPDASAAAVGLDRKVAPDPDLAALSVRVVDEHEVPIADVPVDAWRSTTRAMPSAITDLDGLARLSLPPGRHYVVADSRAQKKRPDLFNRGQSVLASGAPIDLRLVMERYCCTVQVSVVDDLGAPVEGAVIVRSEDTYGDTPRELITDAGGTVLFTKLPPGQRRFELRPGAKGGIRVAMPKDPEQSCTVVRDGFARVEYRLPRKGTVRFVVQGFKGADLLFRLRYATDGEWHYDGGSHRTLDGAVAVRLPPGRFAVHDPHLDAATPAFVRGGITFDVTSGDEIEVPIRIEPAAAILSLTLIDEHGQPVDQAHVYVTGSQPGSWFKYAAAATGPAGRYVLRGIPEEELSVHIDARGLSDRNLAYFGGTDDKQYLGLPGPTTDLVVVLHDAYSIRGSVLDADGRTLTSGEVSRGRGSSSGNWSDRVSIGTDRRGLPAVGGVFEFLNLRPGKYPLWIGSTEQGPPDAEVEVGPRVTPARTAEVVLRQRPHANAK